MEQFFGLALMAIVIEGVITYIKEIFVNKNVMWQQVLGIVLGIIVAIGYNADLFALFGLTSTIPLLGCVLTGVLLSRGSNYIFDLVKQLQGYQTKE